MKHIYFILVLVISLNIGVLYSRGMSNYDKTLYLLDYDKTLYVLDGIIGKREATMYLSIENNTGNFYGKYYYNDEKKFRYLVDGNLNKRLILLREISGIENYDIKETVTPVFRGRFNRTKMTFTGVKLDKLLDEKDKFNFALYKKYPVNIIRSVLDKNSSDINFLYESLILNNPEKSESINKINNRLNNKNYFDILYNNFKEYKSEYKKKFGKDYKNTWSYEKTYDIIYMDTKILSILEFDYSTTGAAHGTYSFLPSVFNLETGGIINTQVTNFINDINNDRLILLMREKLRNSSLYFEYDKIRLNSSFYFDADNVYFVYNIYEIASYASGITTLRFSYEEIKPFVRRDSIFWYLFEKEETYE